MRPTAWLPVLAACLPACSTFVEPDVLYHECERVHYEELFNPGTTMEQLYERCWQLDNAEINSSDVTPDEGDLIIKVNAPSGGHREQWFGSDQAPMLYHHLSSDFLVATRTEALHKANTGHCLPDHNMAGWVLRRTEPALRWATFLLGPTDPENYDCSDDSVDLPPTEAQVHSPADHWSFDFTALDIGVDGEADLAICRLDNTVYYYVRKPEEGEPTPEWGDPIAQHDVGHGELDVGLTAGGREPNFLVEAHFDWAVIQEGIGADGCKAALERVGEPVSD